MTVRTRFATTSAVLLATLVAGVPAARAAVESQDQLQSLYNEGKYAELVPKLNAALALKGPGAAAYDKYQLFMLKGEAQLRTSGAASAVPAFRAASMATTDEKQVSAARALAALMGRTSGTKYKAKPAPAAKAAKGVAAAPATQPATFDVTNVDDRKQAFAALFTEMLAADTPVVDRAKKATALAALTTAATSLSDLRPVEVEATGDDAQSKDLLKSVGDRAVELMTKATDQLTDQVKTIGDNAASGGNNNGNQNGRRSTMRGNGGANVNVPGTDAGNVGPNGIPYGGVYANAQKPTLSAADESSLRDIAGTAKKIDATATSMTATFGTGVDFTAVKSDAAKVVDAVNEVLKKYKKTPVQ